MLKQVQLIGSLRSSFSDVPLGGQDPQARGQEMPSLSQIKYYSMMDERGYYSQINKPLEKESSPIYCLFIYLVIMKDL